MHIFEHQCDCVLKWRRAFAAKQVPNFKHWRKGRVGLTRQLGFHFSIPFVFQRKFSVDPKLVNRIKAKFKSHWLNVDLPTTLGNGKNCNILRSNETAHEHCVLMQAALFLTALVPFNSRSPIRGNFPKRFTINYRELRSDSC